ncbi:oligogalacturonide transport system substrate-binding protein [Rhizobium sp. RU35A]|uniref:Carbohydrate ABC transporter substrate-binding protein n=1 Tax=Rhizobium straminoryzae TaxID=1387186 RepID=A0A549SLE5_9HYPH|nr:MULTISPECIES: ABC transporter substrate-binding protein [Rhizobium]TRL30453.1 carbohydrate ABC transporter substrate-binding protein [Rhizobium straminoryzae]SIQ86106.1 oligogalacturonide transport system substrate-binding protein [Rhizobium sp. RU35A]
MKLTKLFLATALAATSLAQAAGAADLRMSWWGGDSRHKATQAALKACGDKYGHTIAAEFTGWDGHLEKVTTQIAGGTEADIMQINWPWLPLFSIKGDGFADLNQYKDVIDLSQWSADDLAAGTMNGKLNGLSVSTTGRVFMFNKTAFDKAGVALPKTWDELFAAAKQLKAKAGPDAYPMNAVKETAVLLISLYATQNTGKDLVDPVAKKVAWSEDDLAKAIEFYGKLVKDGVVVSQKGNAAEGNLNLFESPKWADGRISGSYEWDSTFSKYADPLKGQVLEPVAILKNADAKTEGVYRKPSMVFSISKRSKNPKAAAQIVNCLLNEPEGITALGTSRGLPASKIAAKMLADAGKIEAPIAAAHDLIVKGTGPTVSPLNEHPEIRAVFLDTLEEYGYEQISAKDAAEQIIEGVNGVLKKF